ncbi:MAG: hypothetical protein AAF607_12640 [Pseudomonadota bacterium]
MTFKSTTKAALIAAFLIGSFAATHSAFAQGEDGTKAQRNLQIIAEMLPGRYDNANQSYFDRRLKKPEGQRHARSALQVARLDAPDISAAVFRATLSRGEAAAQSFVYALNVDEKDSEAVRMRVYAADAAADVGKDSYLKGCDLLWREEAGQFAGSVESSRKCKSKHAATAMLLSEDALWANFKDSDQGYFTLERARSFSCYVDVPGVGGGRDIPYKRYEIADIHDKGGKEWIALDDGSEVSITLTNVRWPMNNLKGIFTRHSFVMYVGKRENGEEREVSYAWTLPTAPRIGMNLKWMLVNCYMLSSQDVTPFFKDEPLP